MATPQIEVRGGGHLPQMPHPGSAIAGVLHGGTVVLCGGIVVAYTPCINLCNLEIIIM